jgi:hypothetical protein
MKRILIIFIILLASCNLKKDGKLVPNTPAILLDKEVIPNSRHEERFAASYYFVFYVDNDACSVNVSKEFYDSYNVGDTVYGYQVIPNE